MRYFYVIFLLFMVSLTACTHKKASEPKDAQKKEIERNIEFVPQQIEVALGESIYYRLFRTQKKLEVSEEFGAYANEIAKKMAPSSHRPELNYQVYFIDSKDLFAYGLPGGKILISKGLLNLVKNESEFANLIANQMAHIAKQHLVHDLFKDYEYAKALKDGNITERVVSQAEFILIDIGYVESMVNSADRLAPVYAMHAGYSTDGLLTLLQSAKADMQKSSKYGKNVFNFNMINHRESMNSVFAKSMESKDKSGFTKADDRFATMIKKIKPAKK